MLKFQRLAMHIVSDIDFFLSSVGSSFQNYLGNIILIIILWWSQHIANTQIVPQSTPQNSFFVATIPEYCPPLQRESLCLLSPCLFLRRKLWPFSVKTMSVTVQMRAISSVYWLLWSSCWSWWLVKRWLAFLYLSSHYLSKSWLWHPVKEWIRR